MLVCVGGWSGVVGCTYSTVRKNLASMPFITRLGGGSGYGALRFRASWQRSK